MGESYFVESNCFTEVITRLHSRVWGLVATMVLQVLICFGSPEGEIELREWSCFGGSASRSGAVDVEFSFGELKPTWTFKPGETRWAYRKGISVWSSPAIAEVDGQARVYIGSYDHHLYCLDGESGRKIWAFIAGDGVFSTPAVGLLKRGPAVFFGSADRTVYAISAVDGKRLWSFEVYPWKDTVLPAVMSSPALHKEDGRLYVFIGASYQDRTAFKNVQKGELLALDAETGKARWRKLLTTTFVTSPCIGKVGGEHRVFAATQDGIVRALQIDNGDEVWRFAANELIHGSVSFGVIQGRAMVFIGTRHHSVYALDAATGKRKWKYKCGYWVDSTPAVVDVDGQAIVLFGSYDRGVYAVDALKGRELWKRATKDWVSASGAVGLLNGKRSLFISGLDGNLYGIDAASGAVNAKFRGGKIIWSHVQQGDAIWSSPAAGQVSNTKLLVYPSYSYQVHGFVEKD